MNDVSSPMVSRPLAISRLPLDPRRWADPDRYDITRKTSGHVGFGSGIHMCVGQLVARLEGEVMLAALARKVAAIEMSGPVKRRYNNTLRGLESG